MGRKRIEEYHPEDNSPGGLNVTIRLPTALLLRLEKEKYERAVDSITARGTRSEGSTTALIREALEFFLKDREARRAETPRLPF